MKQALKQQGFEGLGRKQTEWKSWMDREKEVLVEIAQTHSFEIISLGGGRQHMELPEYRAAAQRFQNAQEQAVKVENELAVLEQQKQALQGSVRLLKAVDKVHTDIECIQPERTLTGAVKGVTVEQVQELKAMAVQSVAAGHISAHMFFYRICNLWTTLKQSNHGLNFFVFCNKFCIICIILTIFNAARNNSNWFFKTFHCANGCLWSGRNTIIYKQNIFDIGNFLQTVWQWLESFETFQTFFPIKTQSKIGRAHV